MGLPISIEKIIIFMVVDKHSKNAHFPPMSIHISIAIVGQTFIWNIIKPHGFQKNIISDKDYLYECIMGGIVQIN